jgi:flagellar M-ring protein FliF
VELGRFDNTNAPKVQKKLTDSKILYRQAQPDFTFLVQKSDLDKAKLVLAEADLDPNGAIWSNGASWRTMTSWSDTEFDKRQLWVEQMQAQLVSAIRALSVVDQAKVQITIPMQQALFKDQEKPPKASVLILPKKGQKLTTPIVESIMEMVAGAVDGLDKANVVVMDSSTSRVVSADAFKQQSSPAAAGELSNVQLTAQKQYTDHWQQLLTEQLERVAGAGNVSVIVNPVINWERVTEEVTNYTPNGTGGKGVVLSESTKKNTTEGGGSTTTANPSGVTPNVETGVPGYPGTTNPQVGAGSSDSVDSIVNYLVSQTKRTTAKDGGALQEISVGVFVNSKTVDAAAEQAMQQVVKTAMGNQAQVQVAALQFAPSAWDTANAPAAPVVAKAPSYNWLYVILTVALTLGAIGFVMLAFRPRKPVLEPVFAGPEAAMMGGIPVADLEMAAAADAYQAQASPAAMMLAEEKREPQTAEDIAALAPEEIALLGDDFLQQLGVDPAKVRMREKVEKIAKTNPEAVATLLKTWIQEG